MKGGVVMCELTKTVRRTTMDIDIDFVRYSISETSIKRVVARWARESWTPVETPERGGWRLFKVGVEMR